MPEATRGHSQNLLKVLSVYDNTILCTFCINTMSHGARPEKRALFKYDSFAKEPYSNGTLLQKLLNMLSVYDNIISCTLCINTFS